MFSTPNHIGLLCFPVCVKKQEIKQPYFEGYFKRDTPFFEVFNIKFYQSQDFSNTNKPYYWLKKNCQKKVKSQQTES